MQGTIKAEGLLSRSKQRTDCLNRAKVVQVDGV